MNRIIHLANELRGPLQHRKRGNRPHIFLLEDAPLKRTTKKQESSDSETKEVDSEINWKL